MLSRLLITTTCVILTLMGSKKVLAIAIAGPERCKSQAFDIYDRFTKSGCDHDLPVEECMRKFNNQIIVLNQNLDMCEGGNQVTLCRIIPGGFWPWDKGCTSLLGAGKVTKEECETMGKEDYVFHGADGSSTTFKGANSRCINAIDYDCHKLCG